LLPILFPFVVSIALLAASPLLARKASKATQLQIDRDVQTYLKSFPAGEREAIEAKIPPPLGSRLMQDDFTYVADLVQVYPNSLLPVVGGVVALAADVSRVVALGILVGSIIIAIVLDSWIMVHSTSSYASRSWHGYSLVAAVGIFANLLSIAVISIWG